MARASDPRRAGAAVLVLMLLAGSAAAQVRGPHDTLSAGEGSGPLSEVSRPVSEGSRAVHDGARTIGESSGGPVRSGPVRDPSTRSMLSGPVSESSQGPMTNLRLQRSGGSVAENSAGAVKHDIDVPLGERISQPLRELGPLQEQLRRRRQQADEDVLQRAAEPVSGEIFDPEALADMELEAFDAASELELSLDPPDDSP